MNESPGMVTARRAAEITGLNERTIRRMIHRGDLAAVKVAVNRYLIRLADLPPRKRNRIREELDALRSDLETLRRRVAALESAKTLPDALRAESGRLPAPGTRSYLPDLSSLLAPRPTQLVYGPHGEPFPRIVDACIFLERHGINRMTPRTWPWLKEALPITEAELLQRTRAHVLATGWRAGGTRALHKCTQEDCVCQWLLDGAGAAGTLSDG
jgi:excisionase family DNA binding protein